MTEATNKALKLVPECWHKEFLHFMEGGDASKEFLTFLSQNKDCRTACEMILRSDEIMKELFSGK